MGGNEIFQNIQSFTKICMNRSFNDFTGWFCHQSPHTCQLLHLLLTSTGSGVGHHEDGINFPITTLVFNFIGQAFGHLLCDPFSGPCPDINHLVVAFAVCDQPVLVLSIDFIDFILSLQEQSRFFFRNHHIIHTDRKSCFRGILVPNPLQFIQHCHGFHTSSISVRSIDQFDHLFLLQMTVD